MGAMGGLLACGSPPLSQSGPGDTGSEVVAGPSQAPDQLAAAAICINELMAVNDYALVLDDGSSPDWVELHNPTDRSVSLDGWKLHGEGAEGGTGSLDGLSMEPGGFLLLYADEGAGRGPLSQPFKLNSDGGAVWLESPDGGGERLSFGWMDDDHSVAKTTDCCEEPDCLEHRYRGSPGASNLE